MIAALALTVAAAALVGAVEYARICVVRARFARAVHAQRRAVPPGEVPPSRGGRGTTATTRPTPASRAGGGPVRQLVLVREPSCPHQLAAPAPVSSAGAGAPFGPAGSTYNTSGRPGHGGAA